MKKEELKAKLLELEKDAIALMERAELEHQTCKFMEKQAKELLDKYNMSTSEEEKALLNLQMLSLHKRLNCEIAIFRKDLEKKNELSNRLDKLQLQAVE